MKIYEDLSDIQLKELQGLKDNIGFLHLQRLHRKEWDERVRVGYERIDSTEEARLLHSENLGTRKGWDLDELVLRKINDEIKDREKKSKKK